MAEFSLFHIKVAFACVLLVGTSREIDSSTALPRRGTRIHWYYFLFFFPRPWVTLTYISFPAFPLQKTLSKGNHPILNIPTTAWKSQNAIISSLGLGATLGSQEYIRIYLGAWHLGQWWTYTSSFPCAWGASESFHNARWRHGDLLRHNSLFECSML